jgi:hypothetical protein
VGVGFGDGVTVGVATGVGSPVSGAYDAQLLSPGLAPQYWLKQTVKSDSMQLAQGTTEEPKGPP